MTVLGNVTKEAGGPKRGPDLGVFRGVGCVFGLRERAEGESRRAGRAVPVGSSGSRRAIALVLAAVGEETMGIKEGRGDLLMSSGRMDLVVQWIHSPSMQGCRFHHWLGERRAHVPHGQSSKTQGRSSVANKFNKDF